MIPEPKPGDSPAVTQLLETARALWERLEKSKAIACLQQAIRSATEEANHERAIQLAVALAEAEAADELPTGEVDVSRYRR